jgi:hypothetical protein
MMAPPPTHTSEPIKTGLASSRQVRLSCADGMSSGIDLDRWAEKDVAPDLHMHDVEDDAVEVKKDLRAKCDVEAVVAKERRLNPCVGGIAEKVAENTAALLLLILSRVVQTLAEVATPLALPRELWIERVVKLSGQHLGFFAFHGLAHSVVNDLRSAASRKGGGRAADAWLQ